MSFADLDHSPQARAAAWNTADLITSLPGVVPGIGGVLSSIGTASTHGGAAAYSFANGYHRDGIENTTTATLSTLNAVFPGTQNIVRHGARLLGVNNVPEAVGDAFLGDERPGERRAPVSGLMASAAGGAMLGALGPIGSAVGGLLGGELRDLILGEDDGNQRSPAQVPTAQPPRTPAPTAPPAVAPAAPPVATLTPGAVGRMSKDELNQLGQAKIKAPKK